MLGIRCLFDPWIRDRLFQIPDPGSRVANMDPGSRIPNSDFKVLNDNLLGKKYNNSQMAQIFFFTVKNKIIYNFGVKFVATKKVRQQIFPPLLLG